ncbi:HAMP domain-containing protein [Ginsengibacter hankyongi]|uniref:histidine kinase n=1 Tax=Ginsengibacter hankyongi TaxID=2607284 RepID=A0A5J5II43_9BACT|nr:ATP-binding protein [Ginsengibacter hankyongi]KAA9038397.1 HAMP domain-containing protein [Ginsengibacter hankyongi]
MALSVKNKIWLGTLFLFLLLLLTGALGIYYIAKLKTEGQNVLKANYESLSYCHLMQHQLDSIEGGYIPSLPKFEDALKLQESNITEPGENKVTGDLRTYFNKLIAGDTSKQNIQAIKDRIQSILTLNMEAIQRKSKFAQKTAANAFTIIISLGSLVFLISFTFLINFPSVVTNPINRFAEAIKEIANKNYTHRIHLDNKDEFGKLADAFNDMAEKLQYFENSNLNKLMFEKKRAEAVINSLKDASIGIDKNDMVLFANHQALQLLGLKTEEIVGKSVNEISARNDLFRFLIEAGNSAPFKVVVDDRENFYTKEVIEIAQGETKNRVIVLKNITSFKELDVAKTNFIATISHELKTPLASSDFSLKLLEDERVSKLTKEQKILIQNLKHDNERMLKILSELLNMSQVEAGKIQLMVKNINPETIIENAIQAVAGNAREKEITIRNTTNSKLPDIKADADKTTWVLNNLLTNAIKYSFNSSTVEVNATQQDDMIVFSVKDHGPGMDAAYLPRLFERYFQVPGSKEKGTGLGLAISKEFIIAQNGKIWVESEIGKGSTFYFCMPV